jgi:hypothetical protein
MTDFLVQLGLSESAADLQITTSLLAGSLDVQGLKKAKNIVTGDKSRITMELLKYTKEYLTGDQFAAEYATFRENYRPAVPNIMTPVQLQNETIKQYKKSISDIEASLKKADESLKSIFENVLADARKQLKEAEDPNGDLNMAYKSNYESMLIVSQQGYQEQLRQWQIKYPEDRLEFIKGRLIQFLEETDNIDFSAELIKREGKMIFLNNVYEGKSKRWKLAFRAGKEVIEPSRAFVQQWIGEL